MLALPRRARRAASRRNGQPTQNCTRVATANRVSRQRPSSIRVGPASMVATANTAAGATKMTRRRQDRRARSSGLSPPRAVSARGVRPYPILATRACRSAAGSGRWRVTWARAVARFTSASATPSVLASTRWTRAAHEPQVIPSTRKSMVLVASLMCGRTAAMPPPLVTRTRRGPWSGGYVVALVLDGGDQAAAVGERLVDLHGDRPGVDVDPRRRHAGQGRQRPLDRVLAVVTVDLGDADGHRGHLEPPSAMADRVLADGVLGLEQPLDRLGGLGHDRVAVHPALAADGVAHAVAQVVVQQQHRDPAQGGVDRRDLGEDVDAVGVLVDQPLQAADLALNPAQAGLQLVLVRRIAPHLNSSRMPYPPRVYPCASSRSLLLRWPARGASAGSVRHPKAWPSRWSSSDLPGRGRRRLAGLSAPGRGSRSSR